jgi:hypothetical protein
MQLICVAGNGLNSCGQLKRLLFYQKYSRPFDDGVRESTLHHIRYQALHGQLNFCHVKTASTSYRPTGTSI